ncbi:dihydrolipoyl dehydrogenase [Tumebacillus permanentifrigoris]|uniref:Dihydrolipoyl dehydrogenase n=1 Tax=Tumebacillus permanentifrigoris TaxID=378543 RepID=A0A316D2Q0_9BACL|nr:dihydrolipoyl dehydrogenase [Tumebacillus permanentifrigoris]PWK05199.1 dihydrolipoamide dehydrogenase [Tumebacillus permanentifrigoris]
MAEQLDIVILGGGTGGYVAAIRAAQLGLTVAVVERDKVGGTCLHRGCIPSKALLKSADILATVQKSKDFGVQIGGDVTLDFSNVMARKQKIVNNLHKGVQSLLKKHNIQVIEGNGTVMGPSIFSPLAGAVRVERPDGEQEIINPRNLIVATGSRPKTLPGLTVDGKYVINSDHALELEELPKSVIIVGAGAIGCEWASMFSDYGVQVTLVEYAPQILPLEDEDVAAELAKLLGRRKTKVKVMTSTGVLADTLTIEGDTVSIQAKVNVGTDKESVETLTADKLLVSVGREAAIQNIGLEATEVAIDRGTIVVDEHFRTKEKNIFAIGDVLNTPQLAHVASHEGIHAVEVIAGLHPHPIDYAMIPRCTYTRPEVASVGYTESHLRKEGREIKVGKFPFRGIGKAQVNGEIDGFVKMIADAQTGDLLGVHMVGQNVTEMISEAGLAALLDATTWEIGLAIHPHPTLSEAIGEAALAVDGMAIHY